MDIPKRPQYINMKMFFCNVFIVVMVHIIESTAAEKAQDDRRNDNVSLT